MGFYDALLDSATPSAAAATSARPRPAQSNTPTVARRPIVVDETTELSATAPVSLAAAGFGVTTPSVAGSEEPEQLAAPRADQPVVVASNPALIEVIRRAEEEAQAWVTSEMNAGRDPSDEDLKARISRIVEPLAAARNVPVPNAKTTVFNRIRRLFGLERFLDDPRVTDILINGTRSFFVEAAGSGMRPYDNPFKTAHDLYRLMDKLSSPDYTNQGAPNTVKPTLDGRFMHVMPNGEQVSVRVNGILGVVTATNESHFALRKPMTAEGGFDRLDRWVAQGALTAIAAKFLEVAVEYKANIVLVGGTGSGKTSLMRGMLACIPERERVITVEEAPELILERLHWVPYLAQPGFTIANLIENAMRARPDRIIVGECRKPPEVSGFSEAINSGHAGSMTTTHADSAEDGLLRLQTLAAMHGDSKASDVMVARQLAAGIDLVININVVDTPIPGSANFERDRKVTEIFAVEGFNQATGTFNTYPVFVRPLDPANPDSPSDMNSPLLCAGVGRILQSKFYSRMRARGLTNERLRELLPPEVTLATA